MTVRFVLSLLHTHADSDPSIQFSALEAPCAAQLEGRDLPIRRKAIDRAPPRFQIGGDLLDGQDFIGVFDHKVASRLIESLCFLGIIWQVSARLTEHRLATGRDLTLTSEATTGGRFRASSFGQLQMRVCR
jgi:hypothetical protein